MSESRTSIRKAWIIIGLSAAFVAASVFLAAVVNEVTSPAYDVPVIDSKNPHTSFWPNEPEDTRRGSLDDGMTIVLPTLAIAFAAFCVWLAVRIVNRRERWAKWTLAGTLSLPVLYVAIPDIPALPLASARYLIPAHPVESFRK